MIACLRGELLVKTPEKLIVMAGGVGYEISATAGCLRALPEAGHQVLIQVHTHVREDALLLYGFANEEEKAVFQLLLSVSGIGPKLALAILSGISVAELAAAIRSESVARLVQIAGVGKKTAERLCLELKDKVKQAPEPLRPAQAVEGGQENGLFGDTVSALVNLGYHENDAREAVRQVMAAAPDAEHTLARLITQALRWLA